MRSERALAHAWTSFGHTGYAQGRQSRTGRSHGNNLALHLLSLADLGRETDLDGGDGTTGSARVASNEAETVLYIESLVSKPMT